MVREQEDGLETGQEGTYCSFSMRAVKGSFFVTDHLGHGRQSEEDRKVHPSSWTNMWFPFWEPPRQ